MAYEISTVLKSLQPNQFDRCRAVLKELPPNFSRHNGNSQTLEELSNP